MLKSNDQFSVGHICMIVALCLVFQFLHLFAYDSQYNLKPSYIYTDQNLELSYSDIDKSHGVLNLKKVINATDKNSTFNLIKKLMNSKMESVQIPRGYKFSSMEYNCDIDTIYSNEIYEYLENDSILKRILTNRDFFELVQISEYRDIEICYFAINPISYDESTHNILIANNISANISYVSNGLSGHEYHLITESDISNYANIFYDQDFSNRYNYAIPVQTFQSDGQILPEFSVAPGYLIICPEEFSDQADRLASWKRRLGFNVTVQAKSKSILRDKNNTYNIIKDEYENHPELQYVLLMGSAEQIFPNKGKFNNIGYANYYSDIPFTYLDSEKDVQSDIYIARLPAHNLDEVKIMIDKTINYEKNPPINNPRYFNHSCHFSFFEESADFFDENSIYGQDTMVNNGHEHFRYVKTCEDIRNYMVSNNFDVKRLYTKSNETNPQYWSKIYSDGKTLPDELQRFNYPWSFKSEDIVDEVNKGISYLLYRYHGDTQFWGLKGLEFLEFNDIDKLTNKYELPIVIATACHSASIYDPITHPFGTTSLCEKLISKQDGGAVALIGFSHESSTIHGDVFDYGFFDAMFPNPGLQIYQAEDMSEMVLHPEMEPTREISKLIARANSRVKEVYGYADRYKFFRGGSDRNRELTHCIGDPTLKFYCEIPEKRPITRVCIGDQLAYLDPRNLVLVNKSNNEVLIKKGPINMNLKGYENDYLISFVKEGYIPSLLEEENLIEEMTQSYNITNIDKYGNNCIISCNVDDSGYKAVLYDIYGTIIDNADIINGKAELKSNGNFSIITLEKNACILDSKTLAP